MATYYVELDGGQLTPDAALKGGTMSAAVLFSGAVIYPSAGGGGGGGNMQTKSVSYTPTESAISDAVTPDSGYDGMDRVNVSVGAISSTYVGSDIPLCDSSDVEATITDTNLIRSHSVDVADGYYEDPVTLLNPFGTATFSPVGTPYVDPSTGDLTVQFKADTAGMAYTKSSYSITDEGAFNVKGAQTYTPGTTDQTIGSGYLLTGTQTILGDADLVAGNIKKDVNIFGVVGTYEGGGSQMIGVGDPYLLSIGSANYFNNTTWCDMSNSSTAITRLSVWAKDGNIPVKYYVTGSIHPSASFHPIIVPSGATIIGITIDKPIQVAVSFLEVQNDAAVSQISSTGYVNYTANTEQTFTIPTGAGAIGTIIRYDSNNTAFTQGQNRFDKFPTYFRVRFS